MYNNFTIEDAKNIGVRFRAICEWNGSYEKSLTKGNEYVIEITPRIMSLSPLCKGIGDNGKEFECHLTRFTKIEE